MSPIYTQSEVSQIKAHCAETQSELQGQITTIRKRANRLETEIERLREELDNAISYRHHRERELGGVIAEKELKIERMREELRLWEERWPLDAKMELGTLRARLEKAISLIDYLRMTADHALEYDKVDAEIASLRGEEE